MKEANNCYECPHRGEVAGSAHSSCNVLGFAGPSIAELVSSGQLKALVGDNGEELVSFDAYGVKNNWCNWPQNFDPTWVTCHLPIEEKKSI